MLVTQIVALILFKPRLPPHRTGPIIEWSAFSEPPFLFFTISMFLNFWGLYFAFFYLGTFARDRFGVPDIDTHTQDLILILNGVGIIGRTVPNIIGDRWIGKLNILIPISLSSSIVILAWTAVTSIPGLYAFTVVYGLVGGAAQSLFPATATTNPGLG